MRMMMMAVLEVVVPAARYGELGELRGVGSHT